MLFLYDSMGNVHKSYHLQYVIDHWPNIPQFFPILHQAIARHEILCTLEDIVKQGARVLVPGGNFFLVHRPFRLVEIMAILTKYKLEPKRMQLVYPFVDKEPNMVLIQATKGGKSRITVEKPLIVYQKPGVYTKEVMDLYEG